LRSSDRVHNLPWAGATARIHGARLLTQDPRIIDADVVTTVA
jgi:hypothetical protein